MSFGGGSAIPIGVVYAGSAVPPVINNPGTLVVNAPLTTGSTVTTLVANPTAVTWAKASGDSSGFFSVGQSSGAITVTAAGSAGLFLNQTVTFTVTATATVGGGVSAPLTITILIDQYVDGYNNRSLTGTVPFPNLLNSYGGVGARSHSVANQPSWYVAGVDYSVGVQGGITVISNPNQTQINTASTGATISGSTVTLTGANPTLGSSSIGFTFSTNTTVVVDSGATGTATIQNCSFSITTANNAIGKSGGTANLTVKYCEINGNQFASHPAATLATGISFLGSGTYTCQYNYLHGLAIDAFQIGAGNPQIMDIRFNLVSGIGYSAPVAQGGHPDTVQFIAGTVTGATFAFNTMVCPAGSGQGGDNPLLDVEAQSSGIISNLVYANNVAVPQGTPAAPTAALLFASFVDAADTRLNGMSYLYNYGDPTNTQFQQFFGSTNQNQMCSSTPTTGVPTATNIPASGTAYVMAGNTSLVDGSIQNPLFPAGLIGYIAPGTTTKTTAAPSTDILGITTSPASGTAGPGTTITFTLTCSRAMTVVGTPTLTLNNGKSATYISGSGTTSLVYRYTVQNGDTSQTNIATTAATANVNATHVIDVFGNLAGMTGALRTFTGLNVSGTNTGVAPVVVVRAFNISVPVAAKVTIATATASQGTAPLTWTRVASSDPRGDFQINQSTGEISFTDQGINDFGGTNPTSKQTGSLTVQATNSAGMGQGAQSFTFYADGSTSLSGAPGGTPQLSGLLAGYAAVPIWQVPGANYAVGPAQGTVFKDPNTMTSAIYGTGGIDATNHRITIINPNVVIDGWDFTLNGGWALLIQSSGSTVRNCQFLGNNAATVRTLIECHSPNITIANNTIDGNDQISDSSALIHYTGTGAGTKATIIHNWIKNAGQDFIDVDTASGNQIAFDIKWNVFENGGVPAGSHADWLQIQSGTYTANLLFNLAVQNVASGTQGFALTQDPAPVIANAEMGYNTTLDLAPGGSVNWMYSVLASAVAGSATTHDNYAVIQSGRDFAAIHSTGAKSTFSNNINMQTGAQFPTSFP